VATRRDADVHIRPYRTSDAARVKALTIEGFEPVSVEAAIDRRWPGLLPAPWGERKWRAMQPELAGQPEHCFVAELDGEVVGYITTTIVSEHQVGRIPDLAVDARVRGRGGGRRRLEHALAHFRALGLRVARIETLAHNEVGQRLYPSVGFQEVARQIHFAMLLDQPAPPPAPKGPRRSTEAHKRVSRLSEARPGRADEPRRSTEAH
jgi:ribosomal protein S18 acetylase RimI-like enzyme